MIGGRKTTEWLGTFRKIISMFKIASNWWKKITERKNRLRHVVYVIYTSSQDIIWQAPRLFPVCKTFKLWEKEHLLFTGVSPFTYYRRRPFNPSNPSRLTAHRINRSLTPPVSFLYFLWFFLLLICTNDNLQKVGNPLTHLWEMGRIWCIQCRH